MRSKGKSFRKVLRDRLVHLKNHNPWLLLLWHEMLLARGKKELVKYSDQEAIRKLYFSRAGRYPDLENPTLFSEKLQWIKLNHRNPLMTQCADKFEVRQFIEEKGYGSILNELIGVFEAVEEMRIDELPDSFVLKAAHGSGWNIICKDKHSMNWIALKMVMRSWLKHNIFWSGREWPYRDMKHRIVCEKYLEDKDGHLADYKFYCFNGQPKFAQVNVGRGTSWHTQNFYDLNWKLLPFGKDLAPHPEVIIPQPKSLEAMIGIARSLAAAFPYVRVDFYDVQGRVVFGELTFFPASGMPDFIPSEYDAIVGRMLTLPRKYI